MSRPTGGTGTGREGGSLGLQIVLAIVISWALNWMNLFGHVTVVERYGQVLFNQLFGPVLYGHGARAATRVRIGTTNATSAGPSLASRAELALTSSGI